MPNLTSMGATARKLSRDALWRETKRGKLINSSFLYVCFAGNQYITSNTAPHTDRISLYARLEFLLISNKLNFFHYFSRYFSMQSRNVRSTFRSVIFFLMDGNLLRHDYIIRVEVVWCKQTIGSFEAMIIIIYIIIWMSTLMYGCLDLQSRK